jgi:hypothetical protein
MKLNRSSKRLIKIFFIFLLLSVILFLPVIYSLSDKLASTNRVDANILIVEGWLPAYAINMANDEFKNNGYDHIVTTGLKYTTDYFNVFTNGSLVFYLNRTLRIDPNSKKHTIEINAYSSLRGVNRAHFNVMVNDSNICNILASKRKRKYMIEWNGSLSDTDSISVQFDNDLVGDFGDRNLLVKEIILDQNQSIPYLQNSTYVISGKHNNIRIRNNYNSIADHARNMLISWGIDSALIISIPGKYVLINRTLTSALAFRNWLLTTNIDIKGINIVTLGTHAKRTWMTYNNVLHKKYNIGIISIPDFRERHSKIYKLLKTIRESLGIVYYWLILLPY